MALKFEKDKPYLMPVFFGPSSMQSEPEGRNGALPRTMARGHYQPGETHVFQVTYETDRDVLESMIPDCYTLNDPYVSVTLCEFTNLGWLNGKTYNLININVPVHFKGERDDLDGDLVLAMFENHADPIVGGRETMGYGKLYCDIPRVQNCEGKCIATASSWDFRFMKMVIDTNKPAPDADTLKASEARSAGKMHYRYFPEVMEKGEDPATNYTKPLCAYPTLLPKWVKPEDYPYSIRVPQVVYCSGSVEFYEPEWEDMPTWYNVGKGLSALVCKRVIAAKTLTYHEPCEYATCYRLR